MKPEGMTSTYRWGSVIAGVETFKALMQRELAGRGGVRYSYSGVASDQRQNTYPMDQIH